MKKAIALALCCALIMTLAACGKDSTQPTAGGNAEIPNPFVEYETLAEAAAAAGFEISVPDSIEGCTGRSIRVLSTGEPKMIEVIYSGAEGKEVSTRQAPGADDIRGAYTQYDRVETTTVDGREVTLHGNNDTVNLATWNQDGYSYSVYWRTGVSPDSISKLVASVG